MNSLDLGDRARVLELLKVHAAAHSPMPSMAKEVLFRLRLMHPEITIVWADSAYAGQLVT
ncbi:hypothetical protein OG594_22720 [Streptomyces sp. NBC_01214]|uniref:hypothetical protein n=1 Tax=Streptomyces sp. NBC_01214 TaxID=2903777 RepID=UPI00225048FD|nr:hypothetical protein [Streptomyces sp. NBC_01214]MCX4804421.1 hypothetical protein [Streptomyces sp. NBC_01214]